MDETRKTKFVGSRSICKTPSEPRPRHQPNTEKQDGLIYIGETSGPKPTKYFIVVRFAEDEG
jgi:hypothetical protein